MPESVYPAPRLRQHEFRHLAELIERQAGIRMPPGKQSMLEGRLRRRLRDHGMESFGQYCHFLFEEGGLEQELGELIDAVTTNKTEFFREPRHFEFLAGTVLPELAKRGLGMTRPLRVWSAGCSIGAEAYTLAMLLAERSRIWPGFSFRILGTDICSAVLKSATRAIYPEEMAGPIPTDLRHRYLLRSRNRAERKIRVAPELRRTAEFRRLNFMDEEYNLGLEQDIVFCRNVIIYFDNAVRTAVLTRICACIAPGGYLFVGHSETISGLPLPLRQVAPTVHVRV